MRTWLLLAVVIWFLMTPAQRAVVMDRATEIMAEMARTSARDRAGRAILDYLAPAPPDIHDAQLDYAAGGGSGGFR